MLVLVALLVLAEVASIDECSVGSSAAFHALGKEQVLLQRVALSSMHRQEGEKKSRGDGFNEVEEVCSTSIEGHECYHAVVWAQNHGSLEHPEWYNGLTHHSSFEEFQKHLSAGGHSNCRRPCNLCHTATQGEKCYEEVQWAMLTGIREHPDWYSGLSAGSSFEEFQSRLHRSPYSDCPEPCNLCRTVVEAGDLCYSEVEWAMEYGIKQHPEWYPGLAPSSPRQEFQAYLSTKYDCPMACDLCHTAEQGEPCHNGVMWAKQHGIEAHPDWYPELTRDSSFEEFQTHLHEGMFEDCPRPCSKA